MKSRFRRSFAGVEDLQIYRFAFLEHATPRLPSLTPKFQFEIYQQEIAILLPIAMKNQQDGTILCWHVLPWVLIVFRGHRPGESRKSSTQGATDRGDAKNCSGSCCSQSWESLSQGFLFSQEEKGEGGELGWLYQHRLSFPLSVCLPFHVVFIRLFHPGSQLPRFPNTNAFGLSQGSSLS